MKVVPFDPATGIFYILDQNTSPDRLVEVSLLPGGFITVTEIGTGGLTTPTTPAAQPGIGIGLTGNEGAGTNRVTGITIDPANGQMYGVTGDRYLFKINKATGKVVPLGMNGGTVDWVQINLTAGGVFGSNGEIEDLAFDPTTGRLYIVLEEPGNSQVGYVQEINPNTGALIGARLGPIGDAGDGSGAQPGPNTGSEEAETEGMTFAGDGTLYISLGDNGIAANDGRIIRITRTAGSPLTDAQIENGQLLTTLPQYTDLENTSLQSKDYESISCNAGGTVVLSLNKTHSPASPTFGQQITFTVQVTNTGDFTSSAQIVDNVPPQIAVSAWSCAIRPTGVCTRLWRHERHCCRRAYSAHFRHAYVADHGNDCVYRCPGHYQYGDGHRDSLPGGSLRQHGFRSGAAGA